MYNYYRLTKGHTVFDINDSTAFVRILFKYSDIAGLRPLNCPEGFDKFERTEGTAFDTFESEADHFNAEIYKWKRLPRGTFDTLVPYLEDAGFALLCMNDNQSEWSDNPNKRVAEFIFIRAEGSNASREITRREELERFFENSTWKAEYRCISESGRIHIVFNRGGKK